VLRARDFRTMMRGCSFRCFLFLSWIFNDRGPGMGGPPRRAIRRPGELLLVPSFSGGGGKGFVWRPLLSTALSPFLRLANYLTNYSPPPLFRNFEFVSSVHTNKHTLFSFFLASATQ